MLGGLVQAGTKALGGDRFSLVNVLPATLLVGYVAFLAASGLYAGRDHSLNALPETVGRNAGWAVLALFAIFVVSVLLRPFQIALVWVLEGYWDRIVILRLAAPVAIEHHRRAAHTAEIIERYEPPEEPAAATLAATVEKRHRVRRRSLAAARARRIRERYPVDRPELDEEGEVESVESRVMPTRLGNILRKAEDDAGDRYGLSLPHIAPRLYPHISDKITKEIVRNLDLIEGGAALSTACTLAALASIPLLWRWDPWSIAPFVAAALAAVAYLGTLRTAREHGRLLATAVDLHRFDMIAALRYKLPTTVDEEWRLNVDLSDFFAYGDEKARDVMAEHLYEHPASPGGAGPAAAEAASG